MSFLHHTLWLSGNLRCECKNCRRPGGDRIYGVFDNQLPSALRKLPFDRHLSLQNVKRIVSQADGYQPHLIAPEQGYRRLIESALNYFRGPAEASVDAVRTFFPVLIALVLSFINWRVAYHRCRCILFWKSWWGYPLGRLRLVLCFFETKASVTPFPHCTLATKVTASLGIEKISNSSSGACCCMLWGPWEIPWRWPENYSTVGWYGVSIFDGGVLPQASTGNWKDWNWKS